MQNLLPQIDYYIEKGKVAKDKIISLFLPEVRSIVRGKAGKAVEFGMKWGINQIRGGWSGDHIVALKNEGVKKVAVAPKGKAKWKVSKKCRERMVNERAQVEGKIGTMKHYGLNKPHVKTQAGMRRAAQRASLRFNMTKILKD